jgi:hypothetical protein
MEAILQTLRDLEGVNGAVVADNRGQILAFKAHTVYDSGLLQQVSRAIVTAIDSVRLLHEDWDSITAQFSEGRLLIRNVAPASRGKHPELTLSVIADTRLNVSFAGVAIRVAVSKLKNLLEAGLTAPALPPPLARSAPSGSDPNATAGSPPASWPQTPAASVTSMSASAAFRASMPDVNNGLSWSGFGPTAVASASGIAAIDAASAAVLSSTTKALAKSVGPMAKRYVKEAVLKLWPDRPFSRELTAMLVSELEKYLEDPADAARFRQAALKSA